MIYIPNLYTKISMKILIDLNIVVLNKIKILILKLHARYRGILNTMMIIIKFQKLISIQMRISPSLPKINNKINPNQTIIKD